MFDSEPAGDEADADLVERMRDGDRDAFARLFQRHHRLVYRFSMQMSGSSDMAEDVTQEVFMALAKNRARYRPERGSFRAYLCGIARHLIAQRERRAWSRREVAIDALRNEGVRFAVTSFDPVEALARAEALLALRRAVLKLPRHYREVVVLCELNGLTYGEAAQAVGCRVGTIRSRLNRARALLIERCRHALCQDGRTSCDQPDSPAIRRSVLTTESGR